MRQIPPHAGAPCPSPRVGRRLRPRWDAAESWMMRPVPPLPRGRLAWPSRLALRDSGRRPSIPRHSSAEGRGAEMGGGAVRGEGLEPPSRGPRPRILPLDDPRVQSTPRESNPPGSGLEDWRLAARPGVRSWSNRRAVIPRDPPWEGGASPLGHGRVVPPVGVEPTSNELKARCSPLSFGGLRGRRPAFPFSHLFLLIVPAS